MTTALMNAIAAITEADYDALVSEINQHEAKLASLRELLKIVSARLGKADPTARKTWSRKPKDPKKPEATKPTDGSWSDVSEAADQEELAEALRPPAGTTRTEHYRSIVKKYIQANGPQPLAAITKATGIPNGSISAVVSNPMFVKTAIGYGLTANHK